MEKRSVDCILATYIRAYIYIHIREGLFLDGDKLEIETINREFLASVHLSSWIESSSERKKKEKNIRGARNR